MKRSVHLVRAVVVLILSGIALVVWFPTITLSSGSSNYLTVKFLDIGQGDAIHVVTPDGYELLIDGGPSSGVLRELSKGRSFFDKKIDMVLATHPDTDHIGGLVDVLNRYQVDWLIKTATDSSSPAAKAFDSVAGAEGARIVNAQAGQVFKLGASTTIRILSPYGDTTKWENNTASIIVQVVYGDIEFMLTGDAPSSIEEYLVGVYGNTLESEVLKLGHHGSKTSSSEIFLNLVSPEFAVVSAGKDNRYGHPHQEVEKRAGSAGAQIVSTAEEGTITFQTDGMKVWKK